MHSYEEHVRGLAAVLDGRAIRERALRDRLYSYFVLGAAPTKNGPLEENTEWHTSGNEYVGKSLLVLRHLH